MRLLSSSTLCVVALVVSLAVPAKAQAAGEDQTAHSMTTPPKADADALQKKATEAQKRIHASKDDHDLLLKAIKVNEVSLAKEVLLRNGFAAEDLEGAKITLQTGGGKGEDDVEISAACCDPKEITIQRVLPYFTK